MLSKKAQYAFHALSYRVERVDEGPVLISKIAEEKGIFQKFLEAILLELKRGGILGSKKGKGGLLPDKSPQRSASYPCHSVD